MVLEYLQEFAKSTWHPSIFSKTEKIVLQQFGIQANFSNLANLPLYAHIWALSASAHPASRANLSGALRFLAGLFVS
jgi:hypothetical protein